MKMNLKGVLKRILYIVLVMFVLFALSVTIFVNYHPAFGGNPEGDRLNRIMEAPNNKKKKFTNIYKTKETFGWNDYKKMIRKMVKGNSKRIPPTPLPFIKWTKEKVQNLNDTTATAVWYGHSAFYLKMNEMNILIDPMFGDRPSPLPFLINKRFNDTLPIAIADLPVIDVIVLSHDHYDHLDYGSILKLKDKTKQFLVPLGVGAHLEAWGVGKDKIIELNWYEGITIDQVKFTCTPAQHFSGRGLTDKMKTLWCSWVIDGDQKIFFSGDSGYFDEFKKIGKKYGPFDICFMECGQYDKLWEDIHMLPEQTAQAHLDLRGKTLIPIHWGAFSLSMHDWNDPVKRLTIACEEKNIELATPIIGEPIRIGQKQEFSEWWKEVQ